MSADGFAVLGPGGVGGLVGGLLARAGQPVVFVARDEAAAHLRDHGLIVRSDAFGNFEARAEAVTELDRPVDACLVAVKATQLDAALERVSAEALGDGLVVPFLNGLEHVDALRHRYPQDQVVAATIRVQAARPEPGLIVHGSPFAAVEIAPGRGQRPRVEALADRLRAAGLDVSVRDDERTMLWDKLSFLAPLALLTTAHAAPAGVIRTREREQALAVIDEVAAVSRADGGGGDPAAVVELLDSVPETMESSMQVDAAAGRRTEIDAIGGAVLRAAERHGVAVPRTRQLVEHLT